MWPYIYWCYFTLPGDTHVLHRHTNIWENMCLYMCKKLIKSFFQKKNIVVPWFGSTVLVRLYSLVRFYSWCIFWSGCIWRMSRSDLKVNNVNAPWSMHTIFFFANSFSEVFLCFKFAFNKTYSKVWSRYEL
jgi:hypothetical protein